jgi:catechol 2,3-dioxygenase-like lactoylglutathione lyase family enzyme
MSIVGCHHIGLTVTNLAQTEDFFTRLLGWQVVRRDDDYPAVFVSNGQFMITLWQAQGAQREANFKENVGLHHLALQVESEQALTDIHQKLAAENIKIEFAPENLREGPTKHMMCYEPSGNRIEFIHPAK